jgi:hypothetical protein
VQEDGSGGKGRQEAWEHTIPEKLPYIRRTLRTLHANPWVSLRRDQLILVNKVVNNKEQLEKGLEEEEEKKILSKIISDRRK